MNFFKKAYSRTYQFVFRAMLPFLPYRQPKLLKNNQEVVMMLKNNKVNKVLLVTDKGIRNLSLTKPLEQCLEDNKINVFVYDGTVANPTTDNVNSAVKIYKDNSCQAIIAFGGGSAMDCAKATGAKIARPKKSLAKMKGVLKVRKRIPLLIAVPTTAGTGSETTLAAVITDSETRQKYAINDFPLIPRYALLDENLTTGLPKHITATTGMDALTHAIEAYVGRSTTKQTRKNSLFAVKTIFENLLVAYNDGQNLKARKNMLVASYNAGLAFTKSYVGNIHAIAHTLGGKYNVAHGLANAIILPYVLKKYGKKIHKKLWKMGINSGLFDKNTSKQQGAKIFIEKIEEMNKLMNIGDKIPEIQKQDVDELAKIAEKEANPLYPVPVMFNKQDFVEIYYKLKN